MIAAFRDWPILNASMDENSILYHRDYNIGIAVALEWGLIVPVVKNADEKNILGLAQTINDLGERAPHEAPQSRGGVRRHFHHHESGSFRRALRHADHQSAAGRHPRRRRREEAAHRGGD